MHFSYGAELNVGFGGSAGVSTDTPEYPPPLFRFESDEP